MDDSALTHQLKQGNQLAFTILYDTYSEQVYRLAFKYLCNKELAEDAVQNLFMKVWIKRTSNAGYTEAGDNEKFENEQNDANDEKQYFPICG